MDLKINFKKLGGQGRACGSEKISGKRKYDRNTLYDSQRLNKIFLKSPKAIVEILRMEN